MLEASAASRCPDASRRNAAATPDLGPSVGLATRTGVRRDDGPFAHHLSVVPVVLGWRGSDNPSGAVDQHAAQVLALCFEMQHHLRTLLSL
jgi:hypothetical protein